MNHSHWITNKIRLALTVILLLVLAGCNMPAASTPTPDLFATLQASTPLSYTPPASTEQVATPDFNLSTPTGIPSTPTPDVLIPAPSSADGLSGHVVFTCQIYQAQYSEQICIMNADGTDYRRLTKEDGIRHFYPSLAPDGKSVLYSAFREENVYEIYEYDLGDGSVDRLTTRVGVTTAPEVSPNGNSIVFTRWSPTSNQYQIWTMDRDGENPDKLSQVLGWDPTWSPTSRQILFASDRDGTIQLYVVNVNGKNLHRITNLPAIRGRSDWSPDGQSIVTYSGEPWNRELFIMNADGSGVRQLTPTGGNSQGPSFSPDGKWVVFTAYFDQYGEDNGCEIYIIRVDGTDLRRLTNNDYCDYQPRWGP